LKKPRPSKWEYFTQNPYEVFSATDPVRYPACRLWDVLSQADFDEALIAHWYEELRNTIFNLESDKRARDKYLEYIKTKGRKNGTSPSKSRRIYDLRYP
jgi:hypothetical protein